MPGFLGPWEILLVFLVALLVFGPKQLPRLARSIGSSVRELREGVADADPRPELRELTNPDEKKVSD